MAGHVRAQRRRARRSQESFGLHELAVEDAKSFHLRPKVEEYETGVQLVILRTARYNHDLGEVD
jgi:magnesium transporter